MPLTIYYINIRGFKTKADSLEAIIFALNKPDVIVLCETKNVSPPVISQFFKNLGYHTIFKKESGVVIASKFKFHLLCVTKSANDNIVAGCIKIGNLDVTIIALYGPQETEKADLRSEFYVEVGIEVQACFDRGSLPLLIGDLNAKIANDDITGTSCSPNGSLLKDVVDQYKLHVLNFSSRCSGK